MTPDVLSLSAFANLQGVRPSYITKLKDHGRLVLTDDGKRVRVAESIALIAQTAGGRTDVSVRYAAQRGAGSEKSESPMGEPARREEKAAKRESGEERLVDAKLRKESAQADQEEMKAKQMAGNLIPKEDVDAAMRFIGGAVRAALEVFPDQTAPLVAPATSLEEVHELLTQACREALHNVGESIGRQKKELEKGG